MNILLVVAGSFYMVEAVLSITWPGNGKFLLALVARIIRAAIGGYMIYAGLCS